MPISVDPSELLAASAPYRGIPEGRKLDVLIYILAVQAGLDGLTASQLLDAAKCYCGMSEEAQRRVIAYLLNAIANAGGSGDCGNVEGEGDPT